MTNELVDREHLKFETRKVHQMFRPGCGVRDSACVFLFEYVAIQSLLYEIFLFELGVSRACSTRYVQPAVNRQPGYRWGDSDSWFRVENPRFLRKVHSGRKKLKITHGWAPRQVLTRQQGVDQMFV